MRPYVTHRTTKLEKVRSLYLWYRRRGFECTVDTPMDKTGRNWFRLKVWRSNRVHENVIADNEKVICI